MASINEKQFSRLKTSIEWSERQLQFPRRKRVEAVKQYVGSHYAESGSEKKVPVNNLKMAVDIYVRQLAPKAPRAMINTVQTELKPTAANLEFAVNQIPDEIYLGSTLRRFVTEALFSWGVVKCGLHTVGKALGHEYGKTFVDVVTADDYFCDMSAKHMEQIQYEGNSYWADYDEFIEAIDKKSRADIRPDEYSAIGPAGELRAEGIGSGESADVYRDRIWLRDVWLPDEGLVITYGVKTGRLYKTVEWTGPKCGPYYKLGFSDVPGNLLPLPPVSIWRDLHELGNALFRKLGNQADGEKSVLGFMGGNEESIADFKNAKDGDGIRYSGTEPKTLTAGGVNPKTLAFYLQCRDLYSYFAGNLDSLGGLGPMTQTVGQDKLLSEAAGAQIRDMASKTIEVVRDIFKAIAKYEWDDPVGTRILEKKIPGTDMAFPVNWNRESKQGSFDSYSLDIDVYSLQDDSPGLKLQKLGQIMQAYILPLAPLIQQAGGTIDVQKILQIVARYSDMPEIGEIVTFMEAPTDTATMDQAGMPANTSREYIRTGRPGMTRQGASDQLQQQLMSMAD